MGSRTRHRVITAQFFDGSAVMNILVQDDEVTLRKGDTEQDIFRRAVEEVAGKYGIPYNNIAVLFYRCVPNDIPW